MHVHVYVAYKCFAVIGWEFSIPKYLYVVITLTVLLARTKINRTGNDAVIGGTNIQR